MKPYDLIVIGGGPAGIFAAGHAAQNGARVVLLEKKKRCGAKLLITGKGRCNITNSEPDPRRFAAWFGPNGRALLTALYAFGAPEVIEFFDQRGLSLTVERGGRVFPTRGDAKDVQRVLERFLSDTGVEVRCGSEVQRLLWDGESVSGVQTSAGELFGSAVLVATGGLSYPGTGCTGDGYNWARELGHTVVEPKPALTSITLAESWTDEVSELNLKNVELRALQDGRVLESRFGEAFFTQDGIGGPIVLDLSNRVREALGRGKVALQLDFKPAVERQLFDKRLQRELAEHANKDFGNALGNLLPKAMIPLFIRLSGIEPGKKCHSVTREERQRLLGLFKELPLQVQTCGGFDKAIVTSGGIDLKEVDMRTLRSKKIANLYFAGEVLDLDGPTGGFNLQVCWSTGYLAGVSATPAANRVATSGQLS